VTPSTNFNSAQGYGWQSGKVTASSNQAAGNSPTADYNATSSATFGVALPNGTYTVTPTLGAPTPAVGPAVVSLEGQQAGTVTTKPGQYASPSYTVAVTDGVLTVGLKAATPNSVVAIDALTIRPVLAQAGGGGQDGPTPVTPADPFAAPADAPPSPSAAVTGPDPAVPAAAFGYGWDSGGGATGPAAAPSQAYAASGPSTGMPTVTYPDGSGAPAQATAAATAPASFLLAPVGATYHQALPDGFATASLLVANLPAQAAGGESGADGLVRFTVVAADVPRAGAYQPDAGPAAVEAVPQASAHKYWPLGPDAAGGESAADPAAADGTPRPYLSVAYDVRSDRDGGPRLDLTGSDDPDAAGAGVGLYANALVSCMALSLAGAGVCVWELCSWGVRETSRRWDAELLPFVDPGLANLLAAGPPEARRRRRGLKRRRGGVLRESANSRTDTSSVAARTTD
jgi:hypothetical protein